jgi:branched-chain amino acid transport system ATP-binding protein
LANRLIVEGLSAGYGAVSVLRDLSLEVRQGELVALLGTNGNGKSTLLNAIMGLIRSTSGSVRLEWEGRTTELRGLRAERIVAHGVTVVPEGRRLFPHLTVEENLTLGGSGGRARARLSENLEFALSTFPMLAERRAQRAGTLSGGQQQVLAIARALMSEPSIMLVDEPSVGLAPVAVEHVFASIKSLQRERGLAVLMAEQSIVQTISIADRSYVITHGRIARELDSENANASADAIRATLLGGVG